jgi:hypothetical protein
MNNTGTAVEKVGQTTTEVTTSASGNDMGEQTPTSKPVTTTSVKSEKENSQDSQVGENVGAKLPPWAGKYLPPDAKNYTYDIWKIIKVEDDGLTCKAEFIGSNVKNRDYHPRMTYTKQLLIYGMSPSKKTFNEFLRINGVDLYKVLTNDTLKQKYEEKYMEYLKVCNESLKWERSELEGKELVMLMCWLDSDKVENISNYPYPGVYWAIYVIYDDGKDFEYEVLKRGYSAHNEEYMKGFYQSAVANNYTETANYLKKYLDAQEYAKEHKLGVWSIDLSDLKTN